MYVASPRSDPAFAARRFRQRVAEVSANREIVPERELPVCPWIRESSGIPRSIPNIAANPPPAGPVAISCVGAENAPRSCGIPKPLHARHRWRKLRRETIPKKCENLVPLFIGNGGKRLDFGELMQGLARGFRAQCLANRVV